MPSEREARLLLERVALLRQLIVELEYDSTEWQCDVDIRLTFSNMKYQLDNATLILSLHQPLPKH